MLQKRFFGSLSCSSLQSVSQSLRCTKGLLLQKSFGKGIRRVPPTAFYICPPVSYSTAQCCVNSRHLSSLYTSTLRRCWGILWANFSTPTGLPALPQCVNSDVRRSTFGTHSLDTSFSGSPKSTAFFRGLLRFETFQN